MTRAQLGLNAALLLPAGESDRYLLDLALEFGDGPTRFTVGPREGQEPLALAAMVEKIAAMLGMEEEIGPVARLSASWPWSKIFAVEIAPSLTVQVTKQPSVALSLDLYERVGGQKPKEGVSLPGDTPSWLSIEPDFTVYSLVISYVRGTGIDVKARVEFKPQTPPTDLTLTAPTPAKGKSELVSFPFPTPPPANSNLQVHYLGLGQRFGPDAKLDVPDPMETLFKELEDTFTTNDPAALLERLGGYYKPERDWFFGAHISLRGWEVFAVLNDPSLYGLRVTCSVEQFKGLLIEILYQKLGSGVGVFYGALTMPERFRTIQLGVVALTLPSFKIWIYTNGDFKVVVGWPLGPESIGIQVYIFTGGGGFYFAKLRSADNPASGATQLLARGALGEEVEQFNPILEFGLGLWFGVGRSFSAGPFSASLSVTLQGTFQGILAWKAPPGKEPGKAQSISRAPDYHWFAATLGVVGVLQGEVDLKIIKLSVLVELRASAGIAFETAYGTTLTVEASVHVEATLKILFIRISVGFSASIRQEFELSSGPKGSASIEGPKNPAFKGMNEWLLDGVEALEADLLAARAERAMLAPRMPVLEATVREASAPPAAGPPAPRVEVAVGFLLQPAAVYEGGAKAGYGVAALTIDTAAAKEGEPVPLEALFGALAGWLLHEFAGAAGWQGVVEALAPREGPQPDPPGWEKKLEAFVATELTLTITGVTLAEGPPERPVAFLPMLEDLRMSWTGGSEPVIFADRARTYPNYVEVVDAYFAQLSLKGLTSNPSPPRRAERVAVPAAEEAPEGPSLTRMIFADYFLTVARHLAQTLAEEEKETDVPAGKPTLEQMVGAAGIGSRYLLNGMRVPNPATTPSHGEIDFEKLEIESGYRLNGQEFALDETQTSCEATLEVGPEPGPIGAAIAFAGGGASTRAQMPVAPVPPPPSPQWSGPTAGVSAAAATVDLEAIPPASPRASWVAARTRLPWVESGGSERYVVPLPPEVAAAAQRAPLRLTVQGEPPGTKGASELPFEPVLLVGVRAHRVDRLRATDLQPTSTVVRVGAEPPPPQAESAYVPFVYRLDGTDDATRARLAAALATPDGLEGASVSVLYDGTESGYRSDPLDLGAHPVLVAKTSLSTTSQPASLARPFGLTALAEETRLGPTAARLDEPQGLARLLWELSVVQSPGFYLRYADALGKELPESIFAAAGATEPGEERTGDNAELTLAITFPAGPIQSWHNGIALGTKGVSGSLYLGLADVAGQALTTLHPSYPPGCVGFSGTWAEAQLLSAAGGPPALFSEDWAAALYHLLQFRVAGAAEGSKIAFDRSLWSLPLGPTQETEGGPNDNYRQVLPAFRFRYEAGEEPNPYDAVGGAVELTFRVGDIFGNVLDGDTHDGALDLRYNDPLLGPGEWPGVRVAHRFRGGLGEPMLRLGFQFDPASVSAAGGGPGSAPLPVGDAMKEAARAALARYAIVLAQLRDARTEVGLRTTVLPDPGTIGDPAAIKAELLAYAEKIVAQLRKLAAGEPAKAVALSLTFAFEPQKLAELKADVVQIEVVLTLSRPPALVYADEAGERVEKSQESAFTVPADLEPDKGQGVEGQAEETVEVGLLPYVEDFEATFAGWDGAKGTARLAVRSDRQDLAAQSAIPPLWVLRLSASAGIDIDFATDQAAYFSLAPLDVKLLGGAANVPNYDRELEPTYEKVTFTGIDLDQWGAAFLAAMDEVLSPDVGSAIAAEDADTYAELMLAKSVLAEALSKGVEPVYGGTGKGVVTGDIESARDVFEQTVLGRLGAAFAISAIVQVPVTVSLHGDVGPRDARLFGSIGTDKPAAPDLTVGSAKLGLVEAPDDSAFLTFPFTVGNPGLSANVEFKPSWQARFLEHLIDEAGAFDYEPSEWLRVVRHPAEGEDPLSFEFGTLGVPVPSRRYPGAPVLAEQSAEQAPPVAGATAGDLEEYLRWNYGVQLEVPVLESQDALWLEVHYNEPLKEPPLRALGDGPPSLFEALASFTWAWPVLRPHLQSLPEAEAKAPAPVATVIAAFWDQAKPVTRAWAAKAGVPDPWAGDGQDFAAAGMPAEPPARRTDSYVVNFGRAFEDKRLHLFARAQPDGAGGCDEGAIVWPMIDGKGPIEGSKKAVCDPPEAGCPQAPDTEGCWYEALYEFEPPKEPGMAAVLVFAWEELDLLALQTARTACWLTRNADLSGAAGIPTNPAFVYRTPEVSFNNPVLPTIVVGRVGPLAPEMTLEETLTKVLTPLARAGTGVSSRRLVKLSSGFRMAVGGKVGAGEPLRAGNAILLADQVALRVEGASEGEGKTLAEFCAEIAADHKVWFHHVEPKTEGALLSLAFALFADVSGAQLPLVQVQALELEVSPGWWPG